MDKKNDSRWFNEILRIEKECIDDYFAYGGEKYPCRNIFFKDENASYIIATERLEKALLPDGETYASEEARAIDEQIFCFVPESILGQSEESIENYVSEVL